MIIVRTKAMTKTMTKTQLKLISILILVVFCLTNFSLLNAASNKTESALNLHELTLVKVQDYLNSGKLSSKELVKYYLDRIKKYDQQGLKLNSVVQIRKNVIKIAEELDNERKNKGSRGFLHGIPVLLKDNIDTADGMANTAGSIALANNYPDKDAFLVTQLRRAGAIIMGKTNLSEWANFRSTKSSSGWSGLYGQSKNPYDITTSPCGSSSGSGIAVAADFTLLAVGTETDGSVTCPSSINGIVGIKPSLGTVSRSGIIPLAHSQDTAGPMARTLTDAVIMLQAMVGVDKDDNGTLASKINYIEHLKVNGLKGKRIGVVRNLMGYHQAVDDVFEESIKLMKARGAIIVDNANIDTADEIDDPEYEVLLYEFKADLNDYFKQAGSELTLEKLIAFNQKNADKEMPYFGQEIFNMSQEKGLLSEQKYLKALKKSKQSAGKLGIDATLTKYNLDLLIAPTNQPAWKIDWINGDHYLGSASAPAAVSGYPHITIPMGFVHHLPIGISFFSANLSEAILIEAAYDFEQASQARKSPNM